MTRRYDPRRARLHRTYTAKQLCEVFDVGLSTVRAWCGKGLQPIDQQRPFLFAGPAIQKFLRQHNKPYQPTGPGEIYCVACKRGIKPAGGVVDFVPMGLMNGNFVGSCPHCFHGVCQRVRNDDISRKAGNLKVRHKGVSAPVNGNAELPRTGSSRELVK